MLSDLLNNGTVRKNIFFLIVLAIFLFFMSKNIDIAITLFASLVFACSLNPLVNKLNKKLNRTLATSIVLFGTLLILGVLIIPILALTLYQVGVFAVNFPDNIAHLDNIIQNSVILQKLGFANIDISSVTNNFATIAAEIIASIIEFIKGMGSGTVYCLTGLILVFFFIQDKDSIKKTVLDYFPSNIRGRAEEIFNNIGQKIGGYVIAQTLAIASVWLVMTIGLLLFKIDYAILFGIITGVLDIIPVVGPAIALVICLIGSYEFGMKSVVIVCAMFALAQFVENNFVRPYAFNKLMSLHPIIIFLSLILGAKYLGFVGVLFAPAIAAMVCVLLNELYVNNIKD